MTQVELMIIRMSESSNQAQVSLRADELLSIMDQREKEEPCDRRALWRPEAGSWMIEGTPGQPYGRTGAGNKLFGCSLIEQNMEFRREELERLLLPEERLLSLTSFPRLGCPGSFHPSHDVRPLSSRLGSLFLPDEAVSAHPRFLAGFSNIRQRRGRKVVINVPIFKDIRTPEAFIDKFDPDVDVNREAEHAARLNHVYMDASVFGTGCCCLQVTMQASDLTQAVSLYDQLAPLTPIALALTAASPIYKGFLTDVDCRWTVISQSLDDRTCEESSEGESGRLLIPKSRYASLSCYLSDSNKGLNDVPLPFDDKLFQDMRNSGVSEGVAKHFAHLFIRDPLLLLPDHADADAADKDEDHFENIQSSNWQTLRFKLPPLHTSSTGWRIEFRPMELQVTAFENAAFAVFIILTSRVILQTKLDLRIPVSKVDENMVRAEERDACRKGTFWFRSIFSTDASCWMEKLTDIEANDIILLTLDDIVNGCKHFPGFVPLIREFMSEIDCDNEELNIMNEYMDFVSGRAAGRYMTTASWLRTFAHDHHDYMHDSVFSESMNYDLMRLLSEKTDKESMLSRLRT